MMRWIVGSSLKFRLLVIVIAAAMMVFGAILLPDMKVDALPEFTPTTVEVQTEALGLSAAEVEQLITVPMEQDLLNGVAWLDEIRSESVTGLSRIYLIFEPGTDPLRARQVVQERLNEAHALPNVSKPPQMLQPLSSTSRFMMIRLSSQELSPIEMSVLAHWTIIPRLMGVAGVANVSEWGHRERQLQVQVDPERLREHDVSLLDVVETTGNALWVSPLTFLEASTPGTAGFIDTPNQRVSIQHVLPIKTADDLAQIIFEESSLRLGDVANVVEDHQPLIGDAVSPDGQDLLLVVEKFPETNTLAVTRGVEEALVELQPGLSGLTIDATVFQSASYIELAIGNLTWALILGAILLVLVLFAFLFDWRSALIAVVAIALSLVAAGLVLYLRGTTFNLLLLAGFVAALGIVVDDAVNGVDQILRRLREDRQEQSTKSPSAVIRDAVLEMRGALAYATLIILVAAIPLLFLSGLAREFSRPLVFSYVLALLSSLVVALTVTPALSLLLLTGTSPRRESPLVSWLLREYGRMLPRLLQRPRWAYAAVGVAVVAGLAMMAGANVLAQPGGLPTLRDRNLLIRWEGAPGTSETEMRRITERASRELQSLPGILNVGAHIGRAVRADQVVNINAGELWVSIDPGADYDQTLAAVREVVDGYPGLNSEVLTYPEERLREHQTGSTRDLVVRVYGEDREVLYAKAEDVKQLVAATDGVVDAQVELPVMEPQVEIEVDLAAAQRYGIKPGDVRRAAAFMLSGVVVGHLFEDQKVFEVVVWGAPETRHSLTSIRDLMIDTPEGSHGQVRLGDVADVRVASTPNVIQHDAVRTFVDVTANVHGRDVGAVVGDVEASLQNVSFPLEYHAEVLGAFAERQAAQQRLFTLAIAAAIGIFLLLQAAFGSWRLATVVFLTLPSALVGGMLAAYLNDRVISLGSLVGLLTVLGIAGRNGIVLIRHYQYLEREEGMAFGPALVLRGARERLSPILMTALATALALVPLVVAGSIPGNEIMHPMAVVILGGLVTSTLLNLFVLPSLYLRFAPSALPEMTSVHVSSSPGPVVRPAAG